MRSSIYHKLSGSVEAVFGVVIVLIIIFGGYGIWYYAASWETIEPGMVGVVFNKREHKVTNVAQPGWVKIDPWAEAIQKYPSTDRTYVMVTNENEGGQFNDAISVQDREGQKFSVDVAIQYAVDPAHISDFYAKFGGVPIEQVEAGPVRNASRSALTNIVPSYRWDDFNQKRGEVSDKIKVNLESIFSANYLILRDYDIRELNLPQPLVDALNAKVAKQQQVEQQRYELEQAKVKAEQDVTEAKGRAEALKAQAAGEAEATLVRARSQAEANRLLAQSLSTELVQYRWVDKWNGQQPQVVGDSTPMVNMQQSSNRDGGP